MAQGDRLIAEKDRCSTCSGVGWTSWSGDGEAAKWIVCRECIGTGRTDQKGRKRLKPEDDPS
jgi:DnaJ-class molecular chaperone